MTTELVIMIMTDLCSVIAENERNSTVNGDDGNDCLREDELLIK